MSEPSNPPRPKRLLALDVMRGVAVFLMMEQHIGVWLWQSYASPSTFRDYPLFVGFNALGGGAAPLFISLAGAGISLFVASRAGRWTSSQVDTTLIRRGLGVMAFGYLLNFLTPSWFNPGSWFVLHLMGAAILAGPIWRRLPTWALLTLAAGILFAAAGLQEWMDTPSHLSNTRMRDTGQPGGAFRLAFVEGQFPIFPWLALFLEGVVLGRWIAASRWSAVHRLAGGSLALGVVLALVFALGGPSVRQGALYHFVRFDGIFYPCSPAYILLVGGLVMSVTAAVMAWERRRPLAADGVMVSLGRASLTLLLLHVWMFRELSRSVGLWSSLSAPQAFGGTLLAIGIFTLLAWQWRKINFRYGAEWVLRKVAG
ncbi:MAG: putative membrane protein [Myxococcota bacterium]|jgi:uncharacterized membrane protein